MLFGQLLRQNLAFRKCLKTLFSTGIRSGETPLKCLGDAIEKCDFRAIEKIICEQDPYEVRRVKMPMYTTEEEPNLIASSSATRLVGCLCEPEADIINWMELSKGTPAKCYCGHWFKLVDFEDYLNRDA